MIKNVPMYYRPIPLGVWELLCRPGWWLPPPAAAAAAVVESPPPASLPAIHLRLV